MKSNLNTILRFLSLILPILSLALTSCTRPMTNDSERFTWKELSDFPEPAGLKGYYALKTNDGFLAMGGSTFPIPKSESGEKTYYDTIYRLRLKADGSAHWSALDQRLPIPLSEGGSIQIERGALMIGGLNANGPIASVRLARWDEALNRVVFEDLPDLPIPCFYPATTVFQGSLYVAGGHDGTGGFHRFWRLDLEQDSPVWEDLPAWPGPERFGAILETLKQGGRERLYLFSGKSTTTQPRSQDNYLKDVYSFDPEDQSWEKLGDMPRATLIGVPGKLNPHTLAIFSGSDGHDIDRLEEIGKDYRLPNSILMYSSINDTWIDEDKMPLGVIGVPLLPTKDGFILASGEYSPALRANTVFHIKVSLQSDSKK